MGGLRYEQGSQIMDALWCAICEAPASHRIDLTISDSDEYSADGYTIQASVRTLFLCADHGANAPLGELRDRFGGQISYRGCLVQCANNAPWHLAITRPRVARPWSKVICPNCHGRAQVQWLGAAVEISRLFDWAGGARQALRILTARHRDDIHGNDREKTAPEAQEDAPEPHSIIIGGGSDD
jgi:hypothetical protein